MANHHASAIAQGVTVVTVDGLDAHTAPQFGALQTITAGHAAAADCARLTYIAGLGVFMGFG